MSRIFTRHVGAAAALGLLASCGPNGFDPDLRRLMPGALSTTEAASRAAPRPQPDGNGLITFPDYQVAIARKGDTPAIVAARLGLGAAELARHNALAPDAPLQPGAALVLPRRVAAAPGAARQVTSSTGLVSDPFAGQGVRQPEVPGRSSAPAASAAAPAATSATAQPGQHVVAAGETAWSIARKYGIGVEDLASWNGLPSSMSVRVGQRLLIPAAGQRQAAAAAPVTTAPGTGSPTPRPPSAAKPLPREDTRPAAEPAPTPPSTDLGATRTAASGGGRFSMPVSGAIIRVYEKGRNEGIDIAASQGSPVIAAGSGTVAAITRDTGGVPIVVIRHDGGLMTVYTGLDGLKVAKGDQVSLGQQLGTAGSGGFVHFEVRRGFDSVDPEDYLG
ncbi:LysM peptidoglycan-binding domain-containing protein [Paracoccus spongiarum]|uniref:Peptidoglycan DD-metalloendopeptidase family protein n=1 Tax=Paracoccus spongiarum TaxID=3064387 RepID=A0ABT9J846_9RHOB|nr:LysM peptidoglycan-binding domain-containing protein [Paracoccus sp. 2205BS29-5]MDP5305915.1 peptidoglycan DD-metalloendopeptidase family protein [Paracoccus sp. 2205BS29-5]